MTQITSGLLRKMHVTQPDADKPVAYCLVLGDVQRPLNPLLGQKVELQFTGRIYCQHCGQETPKSYAQGYCYTCFKRLAECDLCVVSPDRCHYSEGTCRDPAWGLSFCMDTHIVYLANSSGIKVGITRPDNVPTRWIDQGAVQGVPFARVSTRQQAGLLELACKNYVTDRTQWQRMLMADDPLVDMAEFRARLLDDISADIDTLQARFGLQAVQIQQDANTETFRYPVRGYPSRVVAINPLRTPTVTGNLMGIKGQYLMLDTGVINLRKYTSYEVRFSA